jgi:hypothetical protein
MYPQIPNNVLNALWINNISRSKGLLERLELFISFDTSMSDIEALRLEMQSYITAPENSRDFQPEVVLRCVGVGSMDKLQLQLEVRHKSNWPNEQIRAARHSKLMCALVLALRKVPIFGSGGGGAPLGDPANPTYSVSVSDEIASSAREKAAKDADAARLHRVNSQPQTAVPENSELRQNSANEPLAPISESKAADALNAIRLSEDPLRNEERDNNEANIVGKQSSSRTVPGNSVNLELKKSKTSQRRRTAGSSAPTRASGTERLEGGDLNARPSRVGTGNFDQEAHVGG